jgi:hypothetical protein
MFDRGVNGWRCFFSGASDDRTIPTDFDQTASSMAKPKSAAGWETNNG